VRGRASFVEEPPHGSTDRCRKGRVRRCYRSLRARAAALIPGRHGSGEGASDLGSRRGVLRYVGERGLLERRPARDRSRRPARRRLARRSTPRKRGSRRARLAAGEIEARRARAAAPSRDSGPGARSEGGRRARLLRRRACTRGAEPGRPACGPRGSSGRSCSLSGYASSWGARGGPATQAKRIGDVAEQRGRCITWAPSPPRRAGLRLPPDFWRAPAHSSSRPATTRGAAVSAHGLTPGSQAGTLGKATALVAAHKAAAVAVGVLVVRGGAGLRRCGRHVVRPRRRAADRPRSWLRRENRRGRRREVRRGTAAGRGFPGRPSIRAGRFGCVIRCTSIRMSASRSAPRRTLVARRGGGGRVVQHDLQRDVAASGRLHERGPVVPWAARRLVDRRAGAVRGAG
jgi:hypothetical protein